jgi:predicted PurR-regulated permease PerM
VGLFWLRGAEIGREFRELRTQLPAAVRELRGRVEQSRIGREIIQKAPEPAEVLSQGGAAQRATTAVRGVLAVLGQAVVVLFLGIVLALTPAVYVDNLLRLVPLRRRPRAAEVVGAVGTTLRWWLLGRLISMTVIGVLTWIGLTIVGVPLASLLALLAALFTFVPTVGPALSAIPAILLAMVAGPRQALYVALVYVIVQTVESYVLEPIVDRKTIYLPPAYTVLAQLVLGVFAGLLGVAVAVPLAGVAVVAVRMLYVEDVLGDRHPVGLHGR